LEIRNTVHHTSQIFDLAQHGSVVDMKQLLDSGLGSLTDCDELGRSLLGVSLVNGDKHRLTKIFSVRTFH